MIKYAIPCRVSYTQDGMECIIEGNIRTNQLTLFMMNYIDFVSVGVVRSKLYKKDIVKIYETTFGTDELVYEEGSSLSLNQLSKKAQT